MTRCRHQHYEYNADRTKKRCIFCGKPGPKARRRRKHERHNRRAEKPVSE